ncbi:MAG: AhpC/TSA family protein [Tannerella sp.]|jgi:thiol-disulfide isomerase/thioredoxin|nr:AhpC/TSA family protein [Tannerella sp.]
MKQFILGLLFTINPFFSFSNEKLGYTIIGTLPDSIDNVYIYLMPFDNEYSYLDSAIVRKGRFSFQGISDTQKNLYSIRSTEYPTISGWVVIEPGTILCNYQKDDFQGGYTYSRGTYLNDCLTDSILIPSIQIAKYGEVLMKGNIDKNDPQMAEMISEMHINTMRFYKNILLFVNENINNPVGEYIFFTYSQAFKEKDLKDILPKLSEKALREYYEKKGLTNLPKISVGQPYIPFNGKTSDNEYFNLSDVTEVKKVILLDFWASWCAPCLKEMPTLIQLYENYKDNGLEIIGISIDENELNWKKAIQKNKMSWIQVISNKNKSGNIAEMYGVSLIPYTILINENGKVIGDNLRGEELIGKIKSLLE